MNYNRMLRRLVSSAKTDFFTHEMITFDQFKTQFKRLAVKQFGFQILNHSLNLN